MADYSKFIEKLHNHEKYEIFEGIQKHYEYLTNLTQNTDEDIYAFSINNFNAKQFNTALYMPIIEKLIIPQKPKQIYITDINQIKKLFLSYKKLLCVELLRGDKTKMFFDLDCDYEDEEQQLIKAFELINEIADYLKAEITGIIEFPNPNNITKLPLKEDSKIMLKHNPNKKKFCSCHLFIKGLKFYRDDLVKLFKPLYNKIQKENGIGCVFDASVYQQNGQQRVFRGSLFAKPGKQNQLTEYTKEELKQIINNITDYLAQCSSDDKLITDISELEKIVNKYVVVPQQIKTSDKKKYEEVLQNQINNYVNRIKENPKKFSGQHCLWIHDIVKQMKEYAIHNSIFEDTEENRKALFDEFKQEKYQYFSHSQNKKLPQPGSIKWAIDKVFKQDLTTECFYNHDITNDFKDFMDLRNKNITFQELAYTINHTFAFFRSFDLSKMVVIKEDEKLIKKSLNDLVNHPDSITFDVVFNSDDGLKKMRINFKQCLIMFEHFKNKFDNIALYSIETKMFSMYNIPIITLNHTTELNYYIDQILNLICNNNQKRKEYILDWLAFALQNPHKRNHTALQIRGEKGIGKNLIFEIISDYLGQYANINARIEDISATFNSIVADKKLLIFNECPKTKKDIDALKSFITEDYINIREKYLPEYNTKNLTNIIILTNNQETNTIEDKDRRFTYFNSDLAPYQKSFYDEAYENYKQISEEFIDFLLSRDINNYSPDKTFTDDDKKMLYEQRLQKRHLIYRLIDYIFKNDEHKHEITISQLQTIIDEIKNGEDEQIKDTTICNEILNEIMQPLNSKQITNILNYENCDDYILDRDIIKRKRRNYNDVYEFVNQVKKITLKELKERFDFINNDNYENIFSNYIITNPKNIITISISNTDEINDYMKEHKQTTLKELQQQFKYITTRNYKTLLKDYEITKDSHTHKTIIKIIEDLDDY